MCYCTPCLLPPPPAPQVWLVPCGTRPDKPSLDTPGGHRTAMAALAVEASFPASAPAFVVPLERWEAAAVPSYVLMARLASLAAAAGGGGGGGASFSLIIGADLVPTLPAWRHATRLLAEVPFLCVPRPGYAPPLAQAANEGAPSQPQQPRRLVTVSRADGAPLASMQLSSTAVRRILRVLVAHATGGQGGAWRAAGLVAPQVRSLLNGDAGAHLASLLSRAVCPAGACLRRGHRVLRRQWRRRGRRRAPAA